MATPKLNITDADLGYWTEERVTKWQADSGGEVEVFMSKTPPSWLMAKAAIVVINGEPVKTRNGVLPNG